MAGGAEASRVIGMSILGASTGIAIGLVESALKDRWLYVSGGPLAGKQFVLYQDLVTIGRSQSNTIYLFKDPGVLEQHATIEHRTGRSLLTAYGPVVVSGQPLQSRMQRVLNNGDVIQIGRYTFTYAEKERAPKP
jgi:pSer/pThr/pTyr-binding forkhead associated (FHA) protein